MSSPFRYCDKCGAGYNKAEWEHFRYCSQCGALKPTPPPRRESPREQNIDPYPDHTQPHKVNIPFKEVVGEIEQLMRTHPIVGGLIAIGVGGGSIAAAPFLMTIATGLAWVSMVITGCSFLLAGYEERRSGAERGIALGLLLLVCALVMVVASYLLAALGIAGVAGGSFVVGKATVEGVLRKRLERKLREKSISELISISKQLNC